MHFAAVAPRVEPLTRKEAARYLSITETTLARWAWQHKGPRYSRSGPVRGRVLYAIEDLNSWLESRKCGPALGKPEAEREARQGGANHRAYS
jgi:hypothetical protein